MIYIIVVVTLVAFIRGAGPKRTVHTMSRSENTTRLVNVGMGTAVTLAFTVNSKLTTMTNILLYSACPDLAPCANTVPNVGTFITTMFKKVNSVPNTFVKKVLLKVVRVLDGTCVSSRLTSTVIFTILVVILLIGPAKLLNGGVRRGI